MIAKYSDSNPCALLPSASATASVAMATGTVESIVKLGETKSQLWGCNVLAMLCKVEIHSQYFSVRTEVTKLLARGWFTLMKWHLTRFVLNDFSEPSDATLATIVVVVNLAFVMWHRVFGSCWPSWSCNLSHAMHEGWRSRTYRRGTTNNWDYIEPPRSSILCLNKCLNFEKQHMVWIETAPPPAKPPHACHGR